MVLKVEMENISSCDFILQNKSPYTLIESSDIIEIKGNSSVVLQFRTKEKFIQRLNQLLTSDYTWIIQAEIHLTY
jgi:hypothetical protein